MSASGNSGDDRGGSGELMVVLSECVSVFAFCVLLVVCCQAAFKM